MKTKILLSAIMLISIISIAQKKPSQWSDSTVVAVQQAINFDSKTDNADFIDINVYQNDISFAINYLNGVSGWVFPAGANSLGSSASALTANRCQYALYLIRTPTVVSQVTYGVGTTGDYTAANQNVIVLYSWSAGTLTEIDRTADDGNMWKIGASTSATKSFLGGSRTLQPGIYYVGYVWGSSATTTAPAISVFGVVLTGANTQLLPNTLGFNKYIAGTSMPSTINITDGSGTSYSSAVPMIILKP